MDLLYVGDWEKGREGSGIKAKHQLLISRYFFIFGNMKSFLTIIGFLIIYTFSIGKDSEVDSLLKVLDHTDSIPQKVLIYNQLAKSLQYKQIDSALFYAELGFQIASKNSGFNHYKIAESAAILGDLFITDNQLNEAKKYYTIAIDDYKKGGYFFETTETSMVLANIYLTQGYYFESYQLYQECLKISKQENFTSLIPHLFNNIGVIYLRLKDYSEASVNFLRAHELFKEQNDKYNIAFSLMNLANIEEAEGNEKKAISGYLDGARIFMELESWINIADIYGIIGRISLDNGDYEQARQYLSQALDILEKKHSTFNGPSSIHRASIYTLAARLALYDNDTRESMTFAKESLHLSFESSYLENIVENCKLISEIFEKKDQPDSALTYFKSFRQYEDSLKRDEKMNELVQLKMQQKFQASLKEYEINKLKKESSQKQKDFFYNSLIVIILLILTILTLLFFNQRSKASKAQLVKEKLELEKQHLSREILYKNKELTTKMIYLIEKNEFIASIARKLDGIKQEVKRDNRVLVQQIINELKQNISPKNWEEFEMRFMEVHTEFYKALNDSFPDLTPNEKKICAFLRLNMTTKEISAITHQSVNSINTARFRLRKKMGMDRDENLISFLEKL